MSLARLAKERKQIAEGGQPVAAGSTAAVLASQTISPAQKRLRADLDSLDGIASKVTVSPADPYRVEVTVTPKRGIWADGTFCFRFVFMDEYPYEGPKIRYTGPCRVFHPNIEGDSGQEDWGVCLGLQTDWRPAYCVKDLVVGLELLFAEPTYEDPLPGVAKQAAQMLKDNPEGFKRKARRWMAKDYCN